MHQIIDLPEYNNALVVSQHLMESIQQFSISLNTIEKILRRLQSRIYLVGLPLSFYKDWDYQARLPNSKYLYDYGLWVEMNGPEELEKIIQRANNIVDRSLKKTGFLFLKGPNE